MFVRALTTAVCSFLIASVATAEIYRWTDANGTVHFSEDPSRVPPAQRRGAAAPADPGSRVQTYSTEPTRERARAATGSRGEIRIPFESRGSLMWVQATVNDRKPVPFLIDTGASGVSLPAAFVADLGIRIHADTPRVSVNTANGILEVPLIEVDSVQLGGARVENLRATVNPTMEVGLLGGSFFNNFHYSVDAAARVITLSPNESMRAGAAADEWRERFHGLRSSIDGLEDYLAARDISRKGRRQELEERLAAMKEQLQTLEIEANHARVPHSWRR